MVTDAIRDQRVTLSRGIFATVSVGGVERMGHTEPVSAGAMLDVHLRIQAPSWVTPATLEVYEGGRPLPLGTTEGGAITQTAEGPLAWPLPAADGPTDVTLTIRVAPTQSTHYVFLVRGAGNTAPVFSGQPFTLTNPLYVNKL
jgi:hypothetical protein